MSGFAASLLRLCRFLQQAFAFTKKLCFVSSRKPQQNKTGRLFPNAKLNTPQVNGKTAQLKLGTQTTNKLGTKLVYKFVITQQLTHTHSRGVS